MLQEDGNEMDERKKVKRVKEREWDVFREKQAESVWLLGALIKRAQLAPTHYYTMSIDFGLESWPDKMV